MVLILREIQKTVMFLIWSPAYFPFNLQTLNVFLHYHLQFILVIIQMI